MKKMKQILLGLVLLSGLVVPIAFSQPALAQVDVIKDSCTAGGSSSALCDDAGKKLFGSGSVIENITNAFLFVVGAVAVIMIVVGGLRYVMSNGDQASVTAAKNTILYAVIGLVVAAMAYAIVNFVLTSI